MTRSAPLALLAFAAGCGGPTDSPAGPVADGPPVVTVAVAVPIVTPVAAENPVKPPVPPVSASPDDLGGKAVGRALTPSLPPAPGAPVTAKPKPRSTDIDRGEVPLPKVTASAAPLPPRPTTVPRLSPPPENVPELARGGEVVRLPDSPGVRSPSPALPGATDVPPTGRPLPDRAPLTDPTADLADLRVVRTPLPTPDVRPWFAKFATPDPFEFAAQLKGKLPLDGELGTAPAR